MEYSLTCAVVWPYHIYCDSSEELTNYIFLLLWGGLITTFHIASGFHSVCEMSA